MKTYPQMKANPVENETLATLAHDLRTPMSCVTGAAQMALLGASQGKDVERQLRQILSAVHSMDRMLREMCGEEADSSFFTPEALRSELRAMIAPRAEGKHQRLILDVDLPEGLRIPLDFGAVCRVLSNLLVNAVKFTPEGGEVRLHASVRKGEWGDALVCVVRDSGMGMTRAFMDGMYRPHVRAGEAAGQPGRGLGLSIVQRLVAGLGGEIMAESQWGAGTAFTVRLPFGKARNYQ